ncbi:MAG TPA: DUF4160 domain-containing protein [Allosphingosinicella sp.]|jgi:hypothetical protein
MVTIFRESGLSFVIFLDDHPPPHVHVFGDGMLRIELGRRADEVRVVDAEGMKAGDVRKAKRIVMERRDELAAQWEEFHG